MTDITASMGEIAEGALAAHALEPPTGLLPAQAQCGICLNCGTGLAGVYCHQCGQTADVHRTMVSLTHDLFHGLFHFEGKIWRTVPLLAWQPGRLTRTYIDGRRAAYVSPIALFLFAVFLTFALFNLTGGHTVHFAPPQDNGAPASNAAKQAQLTARLVALNRQRDAQKAAGQDSDATELEINTTQLALDGLRHGVNVQGAGLKVEGLGPADTAVAARIAQAWNRAVANPEAAALRIEESAHKFSWLLIPMSVPLMWLLFPFSRRFGMFDHTVFVTYSLSFMLLLQSVAILAGMAGQDWLAGLLLLYVPLHLYRQLRGTYALGPGAALWRTAALLLGAVVVLVLWAVGIVLLLAVA